MSTMSNRPLEGFIVLEFSQFLSGPYAGLRLSDLGARVIKIERPGQGDLCRNLYITLSDSLFFLSTTIKKVMKSKRIDLGSLGCL